MGSHLRDGDRFGVVVRVEVVATEWGHWRHRGERDRKLGGNGKGRVAPHPGAVGDAGGQRLAWGGGLRFRGGGSLVRVGEWVGPGGLQGLLRYFGLSREGLCAGVHDGRAHLWLVGVMCTGPHPIKADLGGVGGAAVGGLAKVWRLGWDKKPPVGLRLSCSVTGDSRVSQ